MADPINTGYELRQAREIAGHLTWLDTITGTALGVLACASGIYTYLGVSSLLDDNGALSFFAAAAYSIAVSVGIFVFWSYLMRLFPAMRSAAQRAKLFVAMCLGSIAIVAMSSWLNAAALAGSAAVEQHLARTVQEYQTALEQANLIAVSGQSLERDVARMRQTLEDLSEQEASGDLSGFAGRGAVFRILRQKSTELQGLETQIATQGPRVKAAFDEGNAILSRMRALTVETGAVEARSVLFSEESVRLAGLIAGLRQLSVAPLVERTAQDLSAVVVVPELDARSNVASDQQATIDAVLVAIAQRAETLALAAQAVIALPAPPDTTYTPISTADAVIRYAGDFVPSWAGAIAIDLLPGVLVFIIAVAHGAMRASEARVPIEDTLTLSELRAAVTALREVESIGQKPEEPAKPPTTAPVPLNPDKRSGA